MSSREPMKRGKTHAGPSTTSASHASGRTSGPVPVTEVVPHLLADEPADHVEIGDPAPEPVVDAVLRTPRTPGAMTDRTLDHRIACQPEQGRKEPMHALEAHGL